MKKGLSKQELEEMIRRAEKPKPLSKERIEELNRLAKKPDEEIDLSDIPEITDFSHAETGKFYKPVKQSVTIRLDADVVDWLKQGGEGVSN